MKTSNTLTFCGIKKIFTLLLCLTALLTQATAQTAEDSTKTLGVPPEYIGGLPALHQVLIENLTYPSDAVENNIQGVVIVQFTVRANGSVSNMEVLKSLYPSLDAEALRVVQLLTDWTPAKDKDGTAIDATMKQPVRFALSNGKEKKKKKK